MHTYIVHYGELALKGKNRKDFEWRLVNNIQIALESITSCRVRRFHSYLVVEVTDDAPTQVVEETLSQVFGIAYVAPTVVTPPDFNAFSEAALDLIDGVITKKTTFKVKTRRGDKRFPMRSVDIDREIGEQIVKRTGAPVDLTNPDVQLVIQIYDNAAYLFIHRIRGAGGLPIGVSGQVLTLLSGGIDSPVAAHMLMKRGCPTDFLHFHMLPNSESIKNSKIPAMVRALLAPHRLSAKIIMVSAIPFEMALVESNTRVATVVFRRFVTRVAEHIARRYGAEALVTGESVGQVASQTVPNIALIGQPTKLPILRPLIGLDKLEIVKLAKRIGTYKISIQPYQDPCSIHARKPATRAQPKTVEELEEKIDVLSLLDETLEHHTEELTISWDRP